MIQDDWGWTPLHHAVWNDQTDMAKLLLSHGTDVNVSDCKVCSVC